MESGQPPDEEKSNISQEEWNSLIGFGSVDWWPNDEESFHASAPMDSIMITLVDQPDNLLTSVDNISSKEFSRERIFEAAAEGDPALLTGLLNYLQTNKKKLTSPDFTDETNGKTSLLKALLNLKDERNDTVQVLLDVAEKTGDLGSFINAAYTDCSYKGQTALHVAIERRSFDHVKLLVQKGADVQAKANGQFFQRDAELGFYFGELPLSLAACTNQPDIVSFLMENPYRRADLTDTDSQGNTVLHTLVVIADNTTENTDMISEMYDHILIKHNNPEKGVQLEAIENKQGLTSLKLAAKLGRIGLLTHMLHREFKDEAMKPLSRKFTEWAYGPVHTSLYDLNGVDTEEEKSVLEIIVFGSEIPNRPEMIQIEPLQSLLKEKWHRFASKLFLMNFLVYLVYLIIFTTVACYRREGQPPFPINNVPRDYFRCCGEIISVLGAVWFFYKAIVIFKRKPPKFNAIYIDGFSDILFFLQATLLLTCTVLYFCGRREYVGLLVLSLALAWINLLYYLRGYKQLGIYSITIQRMILGDLFHFLCVYVVFLVGFSAAFVALIKDDPPDPRKLANGTVVKPSIYGNPSYYDIRFTVLELFKFTIGMGDLQFTDDVQYKEVFFILLILYIVLTYILLLNMLIALMGHTVEVLSKESENIWNLQRASTILDVERTLPKCLSKKLNSRVSNIVSLKLKGRDEGRRFFRVVEKNRKQWRSDLRYIQEEDPGDSVMRIQPKKQTPGRQWPLSPLLARFRPTQSTTASPQDPGVSDPKV